MAGLARDTDRIGLGVLVSPVTFRHPGSFAKVVTTVDEMSGGRIEVGVGAGWNDIEHRQLGLAFPPIKERADLMEDELAILHGLWGEPDGWSYDGHQVTIEDASFQPKPVDVPGRPRTPIGGARPRLLVGGQGSPRTFRLAARYADEFNLSSSGPDKAREAFAAVDAACDAIGRDPATVAHSTMAGVLIGRDEAEMADRLAAAVKAFASGDDDSAWLEERLERWITGTPEQAREQVRRFAEAGVAADHAPGLPAVGPRHDRRHGRGAGRTGLGPVPRRTRSGADVGREVLAGEGGAGRDEVGGRALEDDPAAVVAGAGAEVDDPVGARHDRLVVGDDDDRLAGVDEPVEQAEQLLDVGEVEAGGRLVEDVDVALLGHLDGQLEPLPLAAGQRRERLAEAEVAEPDVGEPVEDRVRGRRARLAGAEELLAPRSPTSRAPR